MSNQTDRTTLVCLFHTQEQARKALDDLQGAGIPQQSIQNIQGVTESSAPEQSLTTLKTLDLPASDLQMLSDGLKNGGTLIVVRAEDTYADKAEDIFEHHHANQVDEREVAPATQPKRAATTERAATTANDAVIPVVEEELTIGKRRVERGGIRVFSRILETPVEEQVVLREEHVKVERRPVNRPISESDIDKLQDRTLELNEMAEEAVVGKTARVVEEIHVGKEASERTQHVQDTVRKTEVEVEDLTSTTANNVKGKK